MPEHSDHTIIPGNELRCVWMDAGVVDYKLCDREYRCEGCPFDGVIRAHVPGRPQAGGAAPAGPPDPGPRSGDGCFEDALERHLRPFESSPLPDGRIYFRSHTWIEREDSGVFRMGVIGLLPHLLGGVGSVVLPTVPSHIDGGGPCAWLVHCEGATAVKAPVTGSVIQANEELRTSPNLIASDAFGDGWILRVKSSSGGRPPDGLTPEEARGEFRRQGELLRKQLTDAYRQARPAIGATMYDGGKRLDTLQDILGAQRYFAAISRLLR